MTYSCFLQFKRSKSMEESWLKGFLWRQQRLYDTALTWLLSVSTFYTIVHAFEDYLNLKGKKEIGIVHFQR
jgi:hypothetical protein